MSFPEAIDGPYESLDQIELHGSLILSERLLRSHASSLGIKEQKFTSTGGTAEFGNAIPTQMTRFHPQDD